MVRVAVLGATGYAALELIKLLLDHPEVELTALTTRQEDSPHVQDVHPSLVGRLDLPCENLSADQLVERADVAFCALPHGASMELVPQMLAGGMRVIDLSADYRLTDPAVYETWYGLVHTDPTRLGNTIYGLPELWSERIGAVDLVANPGCYTSTSILALAPLLAGRLIEPAGICIDAKSGVSGAGRGLKMTSLFSECNESVSAYAVGQHRHTPEIEQVLSQFSGQEVQVVFTPHLIPMDRGIFCTIYCRPIGTASQEELLTAMREFYQGRPFVRIVDHLPRTKDTTGTNFCDVTVRHSGGQLVVLACLDNLVKGAAGVAIQNFNLMYDFPETTGLLPGSP